MHEADPGRFDNRPAAADGALRTLVQAAEVLEYIAGQPSGVGLAETSRALGLPKATTHRIVKTWRQLGYLEQDGGGRYRLGWKVFELSSRHLESLDLRQAAREYLLELNRACGETVHLSVIDGWEVLYVDKVEGRQPIRVYTAIGRRGPLHATASGKAMLAFADEEFVRAVIDRGLVSYNEVTLSDAERLLADLLEIRARGYSVNRGEWHREVAGIGAPVFDRDGRVTAALSATFPAAQLTEERTVRIASLVMDAAAKLSMRMGYVSGRERLPNSR